MSTAGGLTLSNQGGINDENVKEKSTSKTISSSSTCALWGASMITTRSVRVSVYHGVSQMEKFGYMFEICSRMVCNTELT